jgi:hypothetical protein
MTSGWITVYNLYNKHLEFYFAFILGIALILIINLSQKKILSGLTKFYQKISIDFVINLFSEKKNILLVIVSVYFLILANNFTQLNNYLSFSILPIFIYLIFNIFYNYTKNNYKNYFIIFLILCLPLVAYKILALKLTILYLFLLTIIYLLFFFTCKNIFFFILILLQFLMNNNLGNNFDAGDAFHSSEYFISSYNFLYKNNNVFPNIGLIEEIPFLISLFIKKISGNYLILSIATVQSLIIITIKNLILLKIYKKNYLFFFLILILIDDYRIINFFIIYLSIILCEYLNTKHLSINKFLILFSIFPFIFFIIPSSHYIFLFIILALFFLKNNFSRNFYFILFIIYLIIAIIFHKFIFFIIQNNLILMENYFAANAFPLFQAKLNYILIYKFIFLVSTILILAISFFDEKNLYKKIFVIFFLSFIVYLFISYTFTRVDFNASGRLIVNSLLIIFILTYLKPKLIIFSLPVIFLLIITYPKTIVGFDKIRPPFNQINLMDNEIITFNNNQKKVAEKIVKFNRPVVNLSDEPSLVYLADNITTPNPSSIWLYYSNASQIKLINILQNSNYYIYLGSLDANKVRNEIFYTFDGIDTRSRSPLLFKYLSKNYQILKKNNSFFLIPNAEIKSNETYENNNIFSGFDLGKGPQYHNNFNKNKKLKLVNIVNQCSDYQKPGKFRINNENNFFYSYLECGNNFINSIYFNGKNIDFKLIKTPTKPAVNKNYLIRSDW